MANDSAPTSYRETRFYRLLDESIPPLGRIEKELRQIDPALVSQLVIEEPNSVYLLDYYFRLLPPEVGARIIGDESFSSAATLELFNVQMIRYHRSYLEADKDENYASLLESYWQAVSREKVSMLFRDLLGARSSHNAALLLIQNMDRENLGFLHASPEFRNGVMLDFFKNLGDNIRELIEQNVDIYDFVYRLAADTEDAEYLSFLDEFTLFMIQIQIARNMAEDAEKLAGDEGFVALPQLVSLLEHIPPTARQLSLQMMRQRGLIEEGVVQGIMEALEG